MATTSPLPRILLVAAGVVFVASTAVAVTKPGDLGSDTGAGSAAPTTTSLLGDADQPSDADPNANDRATNDGDANDGNDNGGETNNDETGTTGLAGEDCDQASATVAATPTVLADDSSSATSPDPAATQSTSTTAAIGSGLAAGEASVADITTAETGGTSELGLVLLATLAAAGGTWISKRRHTFEQGSM